MATLVRAARKLAVAPPVLAARKQEALPRQSCQKLAVVVRPVAHQQRAASMQLMQLLSVAQATSTVEHWTQETKQVVRLALEAGQVKTWATHPRLVD